MGGSDDLTKLYESVLQKVKAHADDPRGDLDLLNTPRRVAHMMEHELLSSYKKGAKEQLDKQMMKSPVAGYREMVVESGVTFQSLCGHHLMPFAGEAHVGYIPGRWILGLSKIPRMVKFFSRKLQTQERLTGEIADYLMKTVKARGVIVLLLAEHFCMSSRGIHMPGVVTKTSAIRGAAIRDSVRKEFYSLISLDKR